MRGELIHLRADGEFKMVALNGPPSLDQLKECIHGGFLELIPGFNHFDGAQCVAFCNEEGKFLNLALNKVATHLWHSQQSIITIDVLVGDIAIVIGDPELLAAL